MLYRIGEVAEILGITKEGVRFLERKGYLHSVRPERNGYRYYSRDELSLMQQIHSYASVGFTLEEAAALVEKAEGEQLGRALQEREGELEQEIAALEKKKRLLQHHQWAIERAFSAQGSRACQMPPIYYLPLEGRYAGEDAKELRRVEKKWMEALPHTMLAKLPLDREGQPIYSKGICVEAAEAASLGLPTPPGTRLLPGGLCYTAYVSKPVGQVEEFHRVYAEAVSQGYKPTGEMLTAVMLSHVWKGQRCTVSMIRIPLE